MRRIETLTFNMMFLAGACAHTRAPEHPDVVPHAEQVVIAAPAAPVATQQQARAVLPPDPAPEAAPVAVVAPPTPADLAPAVRRLRRLAAKSTTCFMQYGERTVMEPDEECPSWYSQLVHGGRASAFAIGGFLTAPTSSESDLASDEGLHGATGERLVRILGETGATEAAAFMIVYLQREFARGRRPGSVSLAMLDALERLTAASPSPLAPWESRSDALRAEPTRARVLASWQRWYAGHRAMPRDQWLASGTLAAKQALQSDDATVRFAAIKQLASVPAEHERVIAALQELTDRADLPGNARAFMLRFARRNQFVLRVAARQAPSGPT